MATWRSPEPDASALRRWAAAAGAILLTAGDDGSDVLVRLLASEDVPSTEVVASGIDLATVAALSPLLPDERDACKLAAELGKAWAAGRRSVAASAESWAPVVSGVDLDPHWFPRATGETLVGLIGRARRELVIATAYVDGGAMEALLPSLRAAARRGVEIDFAAVERLERDAALTMLEDGLARAGVVRAHRLRSVGGFPHLKVLVIDGRAAYLGSANFTRSGLTTNFELGALVEGEPAESIRSFVLELLDRECSAGEDDSADGV